MENDSENPKMVLRFDGRDHEYDRFHASLFQYLGELSCYNHIFLVEDAEPEPECTYVWSSHSAYEDLVEFMVACDFPIHINLPGISQADIDCFNEHHYPDYYAEELRFPTDWLSATDPTS